ncbi:MAG TPA: hypothetical protein VEM13_08925 [Gemmatimonadales bacterium]|nr:hypothetical protein [Gemmatimonadales bacterium]
MRRYGAVTPLALARDARRRCFLTTIETQHCPHNPFPKEGRLHMPFFYRRALGVAAVAAAAGAGPLAAQQPAQAPQVTVGGLVYTQFVYQLKDTLSHVNNFDITRAYVNVLGKFSGGVGTRLTADIYRNTDGSLAYRLKYAFATYTPTGSPVTYKLGLLHTPWLDWEEALWDYRMQGTMPLERGFMKPDGTQSAYVSASDFGAGVDGKWGPDKVNFQLTVVNGEYYKAAPGDQGKDVMGRVSVRVSDTDDSSRVGGLRVTAYAQYGKPTGGGERDRYLAMVSYRTKQITLAGEAAATQDRAIGAVGVNGRVYSAFGVYKFPNTKAAVLARVDVADQQAGVADRQTRLIGGVSYQLSPNWRLLGDWDYVSFQGTPNPAQEAVRSQALFQTQFTF